MITKAQIISKSKWKSGKIQRSIIPWLFVFPGLLFTLWLRYYPILKGFYMSLFDYSVTNPPGIFIGLKNYITILSQQAYWTAWKNSMIFLLLIILISFVPPLIQAVALSEIVKGRKLFTTIYIVTSLVPLTINVILWKWIWNPDYGLANFVLKYLGIQPLAWLNDMNLVKFSIVFPMIIGGGISVLLYLAAIMGVSEEIYESAQIDGCGGFKKILHITLPNITYIISIQLIMAVIAALQFLDAPFQFTNGGPVDSSTSMALYIYKTVQQDLSYGKSSAAAVLLFVIISVITILQIKMSKSEAN